MHKEGQCIQKADGWPACLEYKKEKRNFLGNSVAKAPSCQCRGPGFDPWPENQIPYAQLKISCATMKIKDLTCYNYDPAQTNKYF